MTNVLQVEGFVKPFNTDGRVFIHQATDSVLAASQAGESALIPTVKSKPNVPKPKCVSAAYVSVPPTISHFVMNLPASSTEFLGHFRGLYAGHETLFAPHTKTLLPVVHCFCFAARSDDDVARLDVAARVSKELGVAMEWNGVVDEPGAVRSAQDPTRNTPKIVDGKVAVNYVRHVSPKQGMYCASFRVPADVAFAPRS